MKIYYRGQRKHNKRQLHISTWQVPNWFEKWFMARSAHVVNYVGSGTKWFVMELGELTPLEFTAVKDKLLIQWLCKIESGLINVEDKL